MLARLLQPLRSLRDALEFGDTPRQLALGVALGMVLGLVPKGNLMCVVLCLTALATRVNLGTTMLSAVACSILSPLADPLTHRIGLSLLTWDVMKPVWETLYNLPLAPWTAFNNTVVLGSLTLGLALFLPTYWVSRRLLERSPGRSSRRPVLLPSVRSYIASTGPIRIDGPELGAFQPSIAMAEPANQQQLGRDSRRRVEPAHSQPAPPIFVPTFPPVDDAASTSSAH